MSYKEKQQIINDRATRSDFHPSVN